MSNAGVAIWSQIAQTVSVSQGLSLAQNARLFAQMSVAAADAFIAGFDAKYTALTQKEVIDFMAANRNETIRMVVPISGLTADIQAREYDKAMPMMSRDLRFLPKALAVLSRSFVELEVLPKEPDMKTLYTEQFLPPAR